jgi:uncharacterized membrane protein
MIHTPDKASAPAPDTGLVGYTHLIYGLHASAVLTGLFSTSTIVGRFIFGLPSLLAVILNYIRRAEVRGTWLQSHFEWQIRTFWFALLWIGVTLLIGAPLTLILIGVYIVLMGFAIVGLWVAYRIVRGWLTLRDGRPMAPRSSGAA